MLIKLKDPLKNVKDECVARGCELRFVNSFCGRLELSPYEQTQIFLEGLSKANKYIDHDANYRLKQWKIMLEIFSKNFPKHEKYSDWDKSLKAILNQK